MLGYTESSPKLCWKPKYPLVRGAISDQESLLTGDTSTSPRELQAPDASEQALGDLGINVQQMQDINLEINPVGHSNPVLASDYRPTSLMNCCVKMITKLLAEKLQKVILKIIHKYQYGFIKHRTIQDCLAWSFEYIH